MDEWVGARENARLSSYVAPRAAAVVAPAQHKRSDTASRSLLLNVVGIVVRGSRPHCGCKRRFFGSPSSPPRSASVGKSATSTPTRARDDNSAPSHKKKKRREHTFSKMLGVHKVALLSVALLGFICFQQSGVYCPNGCNAQDTCGKNDKCTCYLHQDEFTDLTYPTYKGADCSLRTCPYGDAWVSVPTATNVAHPKVECSNKGHCDYSTGHCECFAGYEGKACERTVCPNNCNNRGICLTLAAIIAGALTVPGVYDAWDADKCMGCYCDQGYRGPDCSLKECPSGADMLLAYGSNEGRDCGGRGKCNYDTGDCECFPGYYGTSCESQTTVH